MASSSRETKRKQSDDDGVSPPPLRRKVQSTTTQTAIASFFTPPSQKPPDKTVWHERALDGDKANTLLVGEYMQDKREQLVPGQAGQLRRKVAAFDFDSTLIQTTSGKKNTLGAQDWRWWHTSVPAVLRKLYIEDGYIIAIISNQAGIALKSDAKASGVHKARLTAFKSKVSAVFSQLDLPVSIYAATEKNLYRKPRTGMWRELLEDHGLSVPGSIDLDNSFYVGDAGGRVAGVGLAKDFSSSDRDFAGNIAVRFHAPEEFFLKQPARAFRRTLEPATYIGNGGVGQSLAPQPFSKRNDQDIVLFCGSPGAGKSTFFWTHLQPLKYERINQDILKTRDKCIKMADGLLSEGKSITIDNTNADKEVRSKWVELAARHKVPIRCVLFPAEPRLCEHNDAVRAFNHAMNPEKRVLLPKLAFISFASRYRRPELAEGFQDITEVKFQFQGTQAERDVWARYWI